MKHDAFRAAWDAALRDAGLLTSHDRPEDSVDLATMSRKYSVLVGMFQRQPAEPFVGSMELSWQWDALHSARTQTTEEDVLTELLGRRDGDAEPMKTERPWLRVDIKLNGQLAWDKPLPLATSETWRAWVTKVLGQMDLLLPLRDDEPGREVAIPSWRGEPEAELRCGPSGELWLLGVRLTAWQGVDLPRQWDDADREPDEGPEAQLEPFAKRLVGALDAWKKSLNMLLPEAALLH